MSALSALEKRLTALVPTTWTDASAPPDQRSLFELLAETAATTLRSSSAEVKEAQRSLEDVMLRVTCGGWAGPAVRVTAANVLANLFFVGNEVALYSCVNELVAVAFADDDKKAKNGLSMARASKENVTLVAGYLSQVAAKRIGALDALTRLANKGHADAMRGAAGGVVAAAERLLRRAPERAAAADGSAKGARGPTRRAPVRRGDRLFRFGVRKRGKRYAAFRATSAPRDARRRRQTSSRGGKVRRALSRVPKRRF